MFTKVLFTLYVKCISPKKPHLLQIIYIYIKCALLQNERLHLGSYAKATLMMVCKCRV